MDDDNNNEENVPTTSKNVQNVSTDDDQSSLRRNSEVSVSNTYSNVSDVKMATTGPKKSEKKKTIKHRQGRVEKRKVKRKAPKRKSRTKINRRKRDLSISTIFTRLPSSGYQTPTCNRCGHRCCLRSTKKKVFIRTRRKNIALSKRNKCRSVSVQAGSNTKMLSPLFINTNSSLEDYIEEPPKQYCEITPDMIHQCLRRLSMWRQEVATTAILEYLMQNYPVGSDKDMLMDELLEKLRIAVIVGIVSCSPRDTWSLGQAFQKRELNDNHVTLFWKAYGDTLAPLPRPRLENKPEFNEGLDNEED